MKVFISSTSEDLKPYRLAAAEVVRDTQSVPISMEHFPADPRTTLELSRDEVGKCDLVILLQAFRRGWVPKRRNGGDGKTSITGFEIAAADDLGKPVLAFLAHKHWPGDLWDHGPVARAWVKTFRDGLNRNAKFFKWEEDPKLPLFRALISQELANYRNRERHPGQKFDCIVLSGGFSTRLWPLTINLSKHLLPVGGKPVLAHALDFVLSSASIQRASLLTSPRFSKETEDFRKEYCQSRGCDNVEMLVEPSMTSEGKLGPVGALDYATTLSGPRDLLIIAGDNLFGFKLDDFLKFARSTGKSSNALYQFESIEDVSEFGVASLSEDGNIAKFQEKEALSTYRNISTACYLLRESDVALIQEYIKLGGNTDSLGSFIHWLVLRGSPIGAFVFRSFWFDVGTRGSLLEANWRFLVDSRSGQIDRQTSIEGPVQLDSGCVIKDSQLGPHVYVGRGVEVSRSEVVGSLIMDDCVIRDSRIVNSVIGPRSRIEGSLFEAVCGPGSNIITPSTDWRAR